MGGLKMDKVVNDANPIGAIHDVLDDKVQHFMAIWDGDLPEEVTASWWKFWTWFKTRSSTMMKVVSFLINCMDEFILAVDDFIDLEGKDKKATVLFALEQLYDHIVKEAMPLWLKPFAGKVKHLIIYVMISYMIDFMVEKYRNGLWRDKDEVQPEEEQEK